MAMMAGWSDTPWKVSNLILSWLARPWTRIKFALAGVPWGKGWRFYGAPIIQRHRRSRMGFGPGLQLRSSTRSNPLGINHRVLLATIKEGAVLEVGQDFGMSGGSICAAERVTIGDHVAVGANTTIVDTDFHPVDLRMRRTAPSAAATSRVVIEDDVFIGMNCLVLKGVTIGRGSVIGAGSVVTKSVPPGVIAAGNPARVLKELPK
jgi:acetyltransferase-like isoleucine patch superfamily enzyme